MGGGCELLCVLQCVRYTMQMHLAHIIYKHNAEYEYDYVQLCRLGKKDFEILMRFVF